MAIKQQEYVVTVDQAAISRPILKAGNLQLVEPGEALRTDVATEFWATVQLKPGEEAQRVWCSMKTDAAFLEEFPEHLAVGKQLQVMGRAYDFKGGFWLGIVLGIDRVINWNHTPEPEPEQKPKARRQSNVITFPGGPGF